MGQLLSELSINALLSGWLIIKKNKDCYLQATVAESSFQSTRSLINLSQRAGTLTATKLPQLIVFKCLNMYAFSYCASIVILLLNDHLHEILGTSVVAC